MAEARVDGLRERKKQRTRATLIEAAADLCLRQGFDSRHHPGLPETAAIGRRIGMASDHPAVRMITDIWTVLFATSFSGLGTPGNESIELGIVCERMCPSFEPFRRSWMPWRASGANGQPPASAPTG
jgi:hypothetical protein